MDRVGLRARWLFPLGVTLIVLAAGWVHAPQLGRPFFADDYLFLEQVRGRSLAAALAAPDPLGNFLRPVSRAAYFWTVRLIAGEAAPAYRTVNLLLLLAALVVLAWIARRLAGPAAALFATAYLALHYAVDVPALWVSGAQDLLALFFALAAIALHLRGRSMLGACVLLLGLFSKESVAGTAVIAAVAARPPGASWGEAFRRALPLGIATVVWAICWLVFAFGPGGHAGAISPVATDVPAAFAQLGRVALGVEFRQSGAAWLASPSKVAGPIILAVLAVVLGARASAGAAGDPRRRPGLIPTAGTMTGITWAILGALPVVVVAPIWSAYFYLFAVCGVGLVLGSALTASGRPAWLAPLGLLAVAAMLANARALDEFALAPNRWSPHSHLNRFYLERGMDRAGRYLEDLRTVRPTLPPRSTVFFANLPSAVAFQTADGPLIRWAYADTSLRSYFLREYSRVKAARGPVYVFAVEDDRLVDKSSDPDLFLSVGYSMLLQEQIAGSIEALEAARGRAPRNPRPVYLLALAHFARGELEQGVRLLESLGLRPANEAPIDSAYARALAAGDTAAAVVHLQHELTSHAMRGSLHGELASVLLQRPQTAVEGVFEAFAYRALSPEDPLAWRLWAGAQLQLEYAEAAARSLDRYFAIGGARAAADEPAHRVRDELRRYEAGGDLVQESLRR